MINNKNPGDQHKPIWKIEQNGLPVESVQNSNPSLYLSKHVKMDTSDNNESDEKIELDEELDPKNFKNN